MFRAVSYAESSSEAQIYIFCISFLYYTCAVFSLRRIYHLWLMFSWICCCVRYPSLNEFASSEEVQVTVYMHNTSFHLWACVHIPEHRRRLKHDAKVSVNLRPSWIYLGSFSQSITADQAITSETWRLLSLSMVTFYYCCWIDDLPLLSSVIYTEHKKMVHAVKKLE